MSVCFFAVGTDGSWGEVVVLGRSRGHMVTKGKKVRLAEGVGGRGGTCNSLGPIHLLE